MTEDQELKISRMFKRSQNKRLFTRDNYKLREFVLTSSHLKFFDICGGSRGKIKGIIDLSSTRYMEKVQEYELDNKSNVFQMGYIGQKGGTFILYVVTSDNDERDDWLQLLRHYSRERGAALQPRYHRGVWQRGRYGCCGDDCRVSMGCALSESVVPVSTDTSGVGAEEEEEDAEAELHRQPWFYDNLMRHEAEAMLLGEGREGCFVVRRLRIEGDDGAGRMSLSVSAGRRVHHYRVSGDYGAYFIGERCVRGSIVALVRGHMHSSGGLVVRLRCWPERDSGGTEETRGLLEDFEVDGAEVGVDRAAVLGKGQFGVVHRGVFRGMAVAVKSMAEGTVNEFDFVEEARNMRDLDHPSLVRLFAVVTRSRPFMIVTELMRYGSLRDFLREHFSDYNQRPSVLADACLQVSNGMAYLEQRNFVHRDLAARNVLVSAVVRHSLITVKVADFGMTRFLLDSNVYEPSAGTRFPVRWAAPEVFRSVYTPRADVWSYGVLIWEVFQGGLFLPYAGLSNTDVYQFVLGGGRLAKPHCCPDRLYVLMLECWQHEPNHRPAFGYIASSITTFLSNRH